MVSGLDASIRCNEAQLATIPQGGYVFAVQRDEEGGHQGGLRPQKAHRLASWVAFRPSIIRNITQSKYVVAFTIYSSIVGGVEIDIDC